MPKVRVVIADDHAVVAEGFRALLSGTFDLAAVVHDGRALLDAVDTLRPDVIVTDISMPLLNGLEALRLIRARHPRVRFVVLTMHRETELAAQAFRAGASAYVLKVSPPEELIAAIQHAHEGRYYAAALLGADVESLRVEAVESPGARDPLTPRQREVLQLIAEGRTMKEAAGIMHISPRTAETHKYDMMQALGVTTTAELVQYAMRAKIAEP